jgi:AraC-like DNA-binding protein
MTRHSNERFLESNQFLFHADKYQVSSNQHIESHSHEFVEFVMVCEGQGTHTYKGESFVITQGDVFIIEPDVEHSYHVGPKDCLIVYNVLFSPTILAEELKALSSVTSFVGFFYLEPFLRNSAEFESRLTLRPLEQLELRQLLDRMVREYGEKEAGYRFLIKTKLMEMFIFLSRCYEKMDQSAYSGISDDKQIMRQMGEFIELHHAQPLSLAQISQLSRMSANSFMSKFKEFHGKSFLEYRTEVRIRVAQKLLDDTDLKVTAIAKEVGFDDLSHFNRMFKQVSGMSPNLYRKRGK